MFHWTKLRIRNQFCRLVSNAREELGQPSVLPHQVLQELDIKTIRFFESLKREGNLVKHFESSKIPEDLSRAEVLYEISWWEYGDTIRRTFKVLRDFSIAYDAVANDRYTDNKPVVVEKTKGILF